MSTTYDLTKPELQIAELKETVAGLLEAARHFFEWHSMHFEEFEDEVNMQLLCLANEFETAIAKAEGGAA